MNSTARAGTTSATQASAPVLSRGLYQRLTLRALAQMPSGQLHLELPDGTMHRLGGKRHLQWHATTFAPAALVIPIPSYQRADRNQLRNLRVDGARQLEHARHEWWRLQ